MFGYPFWSFLTSFKNSIPFIWFMHLHFLDVLICEFYSTFVLWYIPGAIEENACAVFTKMWMLCYNPLYVLGTSVQPKPSFSIGNQIQGPLWVLVSEPIFFSKIGTFFFILKSFNFFSCFPLLYWEYKFLYTWK